MRFLKWSIRPILTTAAVVIKARTNVVGKDSATLKFKRKDGYTVGHIDLSGKEKYATGKVTGITITEKRVGTVAHIELKNL